MERFQPRAQFGSHTTAHVVNTVLCVTCTVGHASLETRLGSFLKLAMCSYRFMRCNFTQGPFMYYSAYLKNMLHILDYMSFIFSSFNTDFKFEEQLVNTSSLEVRIFLLRHRRPT